MKYSFILFLFLTYSSLATAKDTAKTDSLKKVLKSVKNKTVVLNELARCYLTIDLEEALRYAQAAREEAVKKKDKPQLGEALKISALAHESLNNYQRSIELADSAIKVFRDTKNEADILRCEEAKAATYMLQGNYNKALDLLRISAEKAKQIDEKEIYAAILIQIGRIHMVRGNYNEALTNFNKALEIANELDSQYLKGHIYHFTGIVYQSQQKFELAIENYLKALPIFEEEHILTQIPYLLVSLGSVLEGTKNFSEALRYYTEALDYYRNTNDEWGLNTLYTYMGSVYLDLNNPDSAWSYYNRSLQLSREIHEKATESRALYNLGEILIRREDYKNALNYLNEALTINQKIENNNQLVDILYGMANCYLYMGETNRSLKLLFQGLKLADSLNFRHKRMILHKQISEALDDQGAYQKALIHFRMYSNLRDSIYKEDAHKNLVEMEKKYESEKQKSEINQLQVDNIKQDVIIRKQKSIRNIFVLGFLFAVIIGYLFYRSYLLKRNANKEKEVLLKEIHHRVKNNLQIISSLLSIQSEYVTDNKIGGAVLESQSRVQAMALIHQMLYQEENLTRINFSTYLKQLTATLASIFQNKDNEVEVAVNAPDCRFNIETSIPLGLIVTELVSNAYKYAFKHNGNGKIEIALNPLADKRHSLTIKDNGKGLPEGTDILNSNSMGLKLTNILTGQLNGELHYEFDNGAVFYIEFTENKGPG